MRSDAAKRARNRYQKKSCNTFVKKLRSTTDAASAQQQLQQVSAMLDKLGSRGVFHKNKSANLKSSLSRYVNSL